MITRNQNREVNEENAKCFLKIIKMTIVILYCPQRQTGRQCSGEKVRNLEIDTFLKQF